jgi:diguanylate cyclase (GGDEF)-like protein
VSELSVQVATRERQIQRDRERQELDGQLQRALAMADAESEVLDVASRALDAAAPSSPAELLLSDGDAELHLAAVAHSGAPGCPVATPGGCAAMRARQTLRFDDPSALDVCPHLRSRPGGAKPAACIPLALARGTSGVLHAMSKDGTPLADDAVRSLELVASHVGARLRMVHVLNVFQNQAEQDSLTELFNRRSFDERLGRMLRARRALSIAIIDLDHFKRLNDTHGHAVGDQALRVFARVLRTFAASQNGIAARLGGEEFALVLPADARGGAETPFDTLRSALAKALEDGPCPPFTVSIGVALHPTHGLTAGELLGTADRALYEAKKRGRDCVVHYSPSAVPAPKLAEVA